MANFLFDALFQPYRNCARTFLIAPDGAETTYGAFLNQSARLANALVSLGVRPSDRVAVQVEKSQTALALYAACIQAGTVYMPLNPAYTAEEVAYFLSDAEPALFICDPKNASAIAERLGGTGIIVATLSSAGDGSLSDLSHALGTEFQTAPRGANDAAALLYTSGTTGRSKGAVLSHLNLLSNALALAEIWHFSDSDVLLHALPIFHVHGLFVATNVILASGGSMIFLPRFETADVISHLAKATAMMGVPTFYTRLLDSPAFNAETARGVRVFISGSAPLLPATFAAFEARTGQRILERYGMTETGMITSNPYFEERRAGSVGFPLPEVGVRIADPDTGDIVPQGQTGVIEVKGPNVFAGYWRRPELRDSEFRKDGYFITGDLGVVDDDGYLSIVGRAKDLIITGGLNVYPKEIETAIDGIEGVVESAVFGVPHPDFGEAVVAAIVSNNAAQSEGTIKAELTGKLAAFKLPKQIFIVSELPRNTMGKVQKNLLRQRYRPLFDEI